MCVCGCVSVIVCVCVCVCDFVISKLVLLWLWFPKACGVLGCVYSPLAIDGVLVWLCILYASGALVVSVLMWFLVCADDAAESGVCVVCVMFLHMWVWVCRLDALCSCCCCCYQVADVVSRFVLVIPNSCWCAVAV